MVRVVLPYAVIVVVVVALGFLTRLWHVWRTSRQQEAAPPNAPGSDAAFVLGMISLVPIFGIPVGVAAFLQGRKVLRRMASQPAVYKGRTLATLGMILPFAGILLSVVTMVAIRWDDITAKRELRRREALARAEPSARLEVEEFLSSADRGVRLRGIARLKRMPAEYAVPMLTSLLTDASDTVRAYAVSALGKFEAVEAIPAIERLQADGSPMVRNSATKALKSIRGPDMDSDSEQPLLPSVEDDEQGP